MSLAKTAELIEMLFGIWTRVVPRNYVLDGDPVSPMGYGSFEGDDCRDVPACHQALFLVVLMSGFCHMQSTNVPVGRPQKQSSVPLNFLMKIPPPRCSLSTKFFDHLFIVWLMPLMSQQPVMNSASLGCSQNMLLLYSEPG